MACITIVDDERDIRELVRAYLKSAGHTVIPVRDGVECLEAVEDEKPDLILMDIRMPRLNGWETVRELRNREVGRDIPVVMLTIEELTPMRTVHREIEKLTGYIEKPFTKSELLETVNEIVKRARKIQVLKAKIERCKEHGESLARSYEGTARTQILHEHMLRELERMKGENRADRELAQIENLVESERIVLETLELKK